MLIRTVETVVVSLASDGLDVEQVLAVRALRVYHVESAHG